MERVIMTVIFILMVFTNDASYISKRRNSNSNRGTYRAAVFEHAVTTPTVMATNKEEALSQMMVNLKEYEKQANIAAQQNVDIIVFPEDGIYGFIRDHKHMRQYIEDIPDPRIYPWNPCDEPTRFPQELSVVVFLSCLAKKNSLYVVANYGDAKQCKTADPNCPDDGQYQFNTDLAFDPSGNFVAKYHKQNLYYETQFDEPITPEYVYFDTEFGRFGMFTCFDVLFHEPMIPLINIYNITDIVFPTAWMDVMPYFSAIGYHSSVAVAYRVNLLSANIHHPLLRFHGSGIYTPGGANAFYYDSLSPFGKLIISDVDMVQQNGHVLNDNYKQENGTFRKNSHNILNQNIRNFILQPKHTPPILTNENTVQTPMMAVIFKDWYHIMILKESSASLKICQRGVCCFIEYETDELRGLYAFGVFNGKHKEEGVYYLQVCILFACASNDINTCGQSTVSAGTKFKSVRLSGTFETPYLTPQIILSNNNSLRLPRKGMLLYDKHSLFGNDDSYPLLEACLFGRFYDRD